MNTTLEVKSLRKTYSNFSLKDISFKIEKNCITGFIGTNGSGKTTTLKSILGLTLKDSGTIKISNEEITKENESRLKNNIGIVLDDGYFYENLTLKEMKLIISPAYSNWDDDEFHRLISLFDLSLKQTISDLSKGMKMKFAISLALSHNADILIMDEPTSGLDPLIRSELMEILSEFMKKGDRSVLFSTHIVSDLEKIADKLIFIDSGEIIFNEYKDALLDTYSLVKGNSEDLNEEIRQLFISLNEYEDKFNGVTNNKELILSKMKNIEVSNINIEDIMLSHIQRRQIL